MLVIATLERDASLIRPGHRPGHRRPRKPAMPLVHRQFGFNVHAAALAMTTTPLSVTAGAAWSWS
jgi:hypothetical protein